MAATTPPTIPSERKDSIVTQQDYPMLDHGLEKSSVLDVATCSNAGELAYTPKMARRKEDSIFETFRAGIVQHQLGLSINLLLLLALTHVLFPSLQSKTNAFWSLSYRVPQTGRYMPGPEDFKHVLFWIVVFTGLRVGMIDYVLVPFASWAGIKSKKSTIRFAEQGWLLMYASTFWTVGMYIYYTSEHFLNLKGLWANFPDAQMTGLVKWYYLAQFAFWLQQILVVHIEERRKDHWQMLTHHFITCALIALSYGYYQHKIGSVILCMMDVVDLFFPTAKMLKYLKYQVACDIFFGLFVVAWFVARHVCYLIVTYSAWAHPPVFMEEGCWDVNTGIKTSSVPNHDVVNNLVHAWTDKSKPVCYHHGMSTGFLVLLLALQLITLIWFGMIVRVAYRVLSGKGANDSRSDDEDDEEEEVEDAVRGGEQQRQKLLEQKKRKTAAFKLAPKEEEVGVEELRFVRRSSPPKTRKSKGMASGISIPGHGDHKELLGRIGCDKPT